MGKWTRIEDVGILLNMVIFQPAMLLYQYLKYVLPYKDDPPVNSLWHLWPFWDGEWPTSSVFGDKKIMVIESPGTFDFHINFQIQPVKIQHPE